MSKCERCQKGLGAAQLAQKQPALLRWQDHRSGDVRRAPGATNHDVLDYVIAGERAYIDGHPQSPGSEQCTNVATSYVRKYKAGKQAKRTVWLNCSFNDRQSSSFSQSRSHAFLVLFACSVV